MSRLTTGCSGRSAARPAAEPDHYVLLTSYMPKQSVIYIIPLFLIVIVCCSPETSPKESTDGYIKVSNDIELYYRITGVASAQDTIVVIHGGPGAGMNAVLNPVLPLADHFVLLFYDQRGGGKSSLPKDTSLLSADYFVEDLEKVRRYFKLESMNLLAHSFGSILVAEYAKRFPARVKRMAFIGAVGPNRQEAARVYQTSPDSPDTLLSNRAQRLLTELLQGSADNPVENCLEYEYINRRLAELNGEKVTWSGTVCDAPTEAVAYYYQFTAQISPRSFGNWDYTIGMDHIDSPLLVIHGNKDSLGAYSQESWANAFPNGQLTTIPEAANSAITDQPNLVITQIVDFFKK
jgi:proline iminopeptidase